MQYGLPLAQAVPLFAALLSLPLSADYVPLAVSPAQQKQQTLHALLTILLRIAAQQPVLFVMEDVHWVDPTTLEFLTLLVDQGPTARILTLCTFRPDFRAPWTGRASLTQVTLPRLPRQQATAMADQVAHGKALPPEVRAQIVAKTDGVPLFVEELTKMVLESGLLQEREERYELTRPTAPVGDSHHPARFADGAPGSPGGRQGPGATGGHAGTRVFVCPAPGRLPVGRGHVAPGPAPVGGGRVPLPAGAPAAGDVRLQACADPGGGLSVPPQAGPGSTITSALPRCWRPSFRRSWRPSRSWWPSTTRRQAAPHRRCPTGSRRAQHASDRSAYLEAVSHVTTGIALLTTLPATPAHTQQALSLYIALGAALIITKGQGAPEVEQAYTRAHALSQQVGETPELIPVLLGLWWFYLVRSQLQTAREIGETLLRLAGPDPRPGARGGGPLCPRLLRGSTLACCRRRAGTWRPAAPPTHRTSAGRRCSASARIWG